MNWLKNYERIIAIEQLLVWQPVTELDPRAYVPEVSLFNAMHYKRRLCRCRKKRYWALYTKRN